MCYLCVWFRLFVYVVVCKLGYLLCVKGEGGGVCIRVFYVSVGCYVILWVCVCSRIRIGI